MATEAQSKAEAAFKKQQDATAARTEYEQHNAAVDANMLRLRAERLARETARSASNKIKKKKKDGTLPETQGEKTRPAAPGDTSKRQNESDRP